MSGMSMKRCLQRLDVFVTTYKRAGKHLHEIGSGAPCRKHFSWRQRAWENGDFHLGREFHHRGIKPRSGQEAGASIDALARCLRTADRAGSDDHLGVVADEVGDQLRRSRYGHGDLDNRYATLGYGFRGEVRVITGGDPDGGDDTDLLDAVRRLLLFSSVTVLLLKTSIQVR